MGSVTTENIHSILLAGENKTVEFKSNVSNAEGHSFSKNVSAFANTEGGIIIFGYVESIQAVVGTSSDDLETIRKLIASNKFESFCDVYTVLVEHKQLIIVEVRRADSLIIVDGGAYIRINDRNIVLNRSDVIKRITSAENQSSSNNALKRLENTLGQMYDYMRHSQEQHEAELKEQARRHEIEVKSSRAHAVRWGFIFAVFSAVLGALIGFALGRLL